MNGLIFPGEYPHLSHRRLFCSGGEGRLLCLRGEVKRGWSGSAGIDASAAHALPVTRGDG